MILDYLENFERYGNFHTGVRRVVDFLRDMGDDALSRLEPGSFKLDEGIAVLVKPFVSAPPDTLKWEAHRENIDMQYMVKGYEYIGIANTGDMQLVEEVQGKDKILLEGEGSFLKFDSSKFIVLYPNDAHMPCATIEAEGVESLKIVFKIPLV